MKYWAVLFREFWALWVLGVIAFTTLLVSVLLLRPILVFWIEYGAPIGLVGRLFVLGLLPAFSLSVPMATLLAALMTMNRLSGRGELYALYACGLSFGQVVVPVLLVGLATSFAVFWMEEAVNPGLRDQSRRIEEQIRTGLPFEAEDILLPDYEQGKIRRLIIADRYQQGQLYEVSWYEFQNARTRRIAEARRAEPKGQEHWVFWDGRLTEFRPDGSSITQDFRKMEVQFPTQNVEERAKSPEEMTIREFRRFIARLREWGASGKQIRKWETQMYMKWAVPFACLVMALFGVGFGVTRERSPSSLGLGLSVFFSLVYYVLLVVSVRVGQAGWLPPILAAWSPNLLFALVGGLLVLYHNNPFLFHRVRA